MTRWLAGLAAALICVTACGKYGAPVRRASTPEAAPAAANAEPEASSEQEEEETPGQ